MEKYEDISVRPYTHKELTELYQISWKTLQHWLKPLERDLGKKIGYYYNNRQVGVIFEKLGLPETLKKKIQ